MGGGVKEAAGKEEGTVKKKTQRREREEVRSVSPRQPSRTFPLFFALSALGFRTHCGNFDLTVFVWPVKNGGARICNWSVQ